MNFNLNFDHLTGFHATELKNLWFHTKTLSLSGNIAFYLHIEPVHFVPDMYPIHWMLTSINIEPVTHPFLFISGLLSELLKAAGR